MIIMQAGAELSQAQYEFDLVGLPKPTDNWPNCTNNLNQLANQTLAKITKIQATRENKSWIVNLQSIFE